MGTIRTAEPAAPGEVFDELDNESDDDAYRRINGIPQKTEGWGKKSLYAPTGDVENMSSEEFRKAVRGGWSMVETNHAATTVSLLGFRALIAPYGRPKTWQRRRDAPPCHHRARHHRSRERSRLRSRPPPPHRHPTTTMPCRRGRPSHSRAASVYHTHALQMMDNVVKHQQARKKAGTIGGKVAADYLQGLNPDEDEEKVKSGSWGKTKY